MLSITHCRHFDVKLIARAIAGILLVAIFPHAIRAQNSPYAAVGPNKIVTVAAVTLKDKTRGKTIEVLVRYPNGAGPFPLIVFSHGSMSNEETFGTASEHWASHGYIVIHPNHADARSRTEAGSSDAGNPDRTKTLVADTLGFFKASDSNRDGFVTLAEAEAFAKKSSTSPAASPNRSTNPNRNAGMEGDGAAPVFHWPVKPNEISESDCPVQSFEAKGADEAVVEKVVEDVRAFLTVAMSIPSE